MKQFVATRKVPKAEFQFVEMPPQYRPFRLPSGAHRIDGRVPFTGQLLSGHWNASRTSTQYIWRH
jgi:hypothetical protein